MRSKDSRKKTLPAEHIYPSSLGFLKIELKGQKLYSLSSAKGKLFKKATPSPLGRHIIQQLESYFKGELREFDIPLFERGTSFQKKVWKAIREIPWGQTKTYREIALQIKIPGGSRAVGNACAKNPWVIVTPCHRVLSQKGYGGFALGLKAKKELLSLEQL